MRNNFNKIKIDEAVIKKNIQNDAFRIKKSCLFIYLSIYIVTDSHPK